MSKEYQINKLLTQLQTQAWRQFRFLVETLAEEHKRKFMEQVDDLLPLGVTYEIDECYDETPNAIEKRWQEFCQTHETDPNVEYCFLFITEQVRYEIRITVYRFRYQPQSYAPESFPGY